MFRRTEDGMQDHLRSYKVHDLSFGDGAIGLSYNKSHRDLASNFVRIPAKKIKTNKMFF